MRTHILILQSPHTTIFVFGYFLFLHMCAHTIFFGNYFVSQIFFLGKGNGGGRSRAEVAREIWAVGVRGLCALLYAPAEQAPS